MNSACAHPIIYYVIYGATSSQQDHVDAIYEATSSQQEHADAAPFEHHVCGLEHHVTHHMIYGAT